MRDCSAHHISGWPTNNIHHSNNPSIKSQGDCMQSAEESCALMKRQLLYLGCGRRANLRGVVLHPNPMAPISATLEAILIPPSLQGPFLESFGKGDC